MKKLAGVAGVFLGAVLLFGCSHAGKSAPSIDDEWMARVPPAQMQPVEQARSSLRSAMDERNRTSAAYTDAKNQRDIAKSELETAEARVSTAEAEVKAAKDTGESSRLQNAQAMLDQAKGNRDAAKAKLELGEAFVDAAKTRDDLAKARVETRQAQVDQAQYQVLAQNGDTRVKDMSAADFQAKVADKKSQEANLQNELSKKEQTVASARQKWNEARSRQGSQPATPPTG